MNSPAGDSHLWLPGIALSFNSGASFSYTNGSVANWKQWLI